MSTQKDFLLRNLSSYKVYSVLSVQLIELTRKQKWMIHAQDSQKSTVNVWLVWLQAV